MYVPKPELLLSGCRGGFILSCYFFGTPSLIYIWGKTPGLLAHDPIPFQFAYLTWIPAMKGLICTGDNEGLPQ